MRLFVILFAALFASAASAGELAGVEARPLDPRVAATWFVRTADPAGSHEMAAVVFLLGRPGWTAEKADWTFSASWPAYSDFQFSDSSFRVELQRQPEALDLLGEHVPLTEANVIVVDRMHSPKTRVIGKYRLDLVAPSGSDPLRGVLEQSERLRVQLGLE
jgi:hypothetical protein